MSKEIVLNDQEQLFVNMLIENGGNIVGAARDSGYSASYAYQLRDRLSKSIAEAAQRYITMHSPRAAKKLVDTMDEELPNPVRLAAINSVLDRAGVKPIVEQEEVKITKANIFILPEKRMMEILDNVTDV